MHWISWNITCSLLLLRHLGDLHGTGLHSRPLSLNFFFLLIFRKIVVVWSHRNKKKIIIEILRLNNSILVFASVLQNIYFLGKERRKIFLYKIILNSTFLIHWRHTSTSSLIIVMIFFLLSIRWSTIKKI